MREGKGRTGAMAGEGRPERDDIKLKLAIYESMTYSIMQLCLPLTKQRRFKMRGMIPQQPPPPCTPLVAVIIVAAATATVLADTVAAFLGLVRAIHECGGDVETMLRRCGGGSPLNHPDAKSRPFRRRRRHFVRSSYPVRPRPLPFRGHSIGNEISPIQGRNVGPIRNRFHALAHPDDPNTIRTRPPVGASLQLRPRRSRHLPSSDWERPHRVRASVPCPSLPWALARPLSLSPSGTGGNIEAAPSLRSQSTGVGAANNGFGRRQHQAVAFVYCRAAIQGIGRLGNRNQVPR